MRRAHCCRFLYGADVTDEEREELHRRFYSKGRDGSALARSQRQRRGPSDCDAAAQCGLEGRGAQGPEVDVATSGSVGDALEGL